MTTEARYDELSDAFEASAHAVNEISGDRLICCDPEDGPAGEVEIAVTVLPKPPGVTFWRSTSPEPSVTLTRRPSGEVTQQLTQGDYPVAVTDTQAATVLGVETDVWTRSRDAIEDGLVRVATSSGGAATVNAPTERHAPTEPRELSTSTTPRVPTDLSQYRDARMLEVQHGPGAALALGVAGNDPGARRQRLAQAVAVRESWHAAADAAYSAAHWMQEPDVPQPFGLGAVIRAEGDLERALADPEVRTQSAERLGLTGHMDWVEDEVFDGWLEQWQPDVSDTAEGRRMIGAELVRIAHEVGVQAPSAPASSESATQQPAQRDRRPALMPPPSMSPTRAQEQAITSPDLFAPGSGVPF